jgi:hypothetical protein
MLSDFNQTWDTLQVFVKLANVIYHYSAILELLRAEGRTDIHKYDRAVLRCSQTF